MASNEVKLVVDARPAIEQLGHESTELAELRRKAALFDWMAERCSEFKLQFGFGGSDWNYPDCDSGHFEEMLIAAQDHEKEDGD